MIKSESSTPITLETNSNAKPASASGAPTAGKRPSLGALTGVRFLAAFYVVMFHSVPFLRSHFLLNTAVERFLSNGYLAVGFFYLLSGFILAYTYDCKINGFTAYMRYLGARFARIYPVYLLALLLVLPFQVKVSMPAKLAVLFMVQAWNPAKPGLAGAWNYPAWSLSVEAFFYVVFPLFLNLLAKRSLPVIRWLLICFLGVSALLHTSTVGQLGAWNGLTYGLPIPLPIVRLPEFLAGMALGLNFLRAKPLAQKSPVFYFSAAAAIALLSLPLGQWVSLVVVPMAFIIYQLAATEGIPAGIFSSAPFLLLGGASYAIYLLQYPVRAWTKLVFSHGSTSLAVVGTVLSPLILILFSIGVYRYWEEPIRKYLHPRRS